MQILIIEGRLPAMNEIIASAKNHFADYSKLKKNYTNWIAWECKAQCITPMKRVDFVFNHYRKDKRQDKDNIAGGAQKVTFDGLQVAGIIKNDGWAEIGNFTHRFYIDKKERIEIEMSESEEEK